MSTRSYICVEQDDGTYKGIYCHCDGYPSHNGARLIDHYNSREMADKMLELGNLSYLDEKLYPNPDLPHAFDYNKRQKGVTVAYGRDRGETGQTAEIFTLKELNDPYSGIDYIYIYKKNNKWTFFVCGAYKDILYDVEEYLNDFYKEHGVKNRPIGLYGYFSDSDFEELRALESQKSEMEM